jgi:hypothetical protein
VGPARGNFNTFKKELDLDCNKINGKYLAQNASATVFKDFLKIVHACLAKSA